MYGIKRYEIPLFTLAGWVQKYLIECWLKLLIYWVTERMVLGGASPPPNRLPYLPFPNQNYSSPNSPRFRALGFEEMTHSGKPLFNTDRTLNDLITPFQ